MKRISQQPNYSPLRTTKNLTNQMDFIRRDNKRHQTTFQLGQKKSEQINEFVSLTMKKKLFYTSTMVVDRLINDVINSLQKDIQRVEINKIIQSTINLTNSMTKQLYYMQNPQKTSNQPCPEAEKQPQKNHTDPISGFNRQNFIKRQQKSKKHNSSLSHQNSMIILQRQSQHSNTQTSQTQKKLPPLMKQLSQQKLQQFIPLEDMSCVRNSNKKPSQDIEEMVRQRFLKQIENRKFKEKIQKLNTTLIQNAQSNNGNHGFKKMNMGSRSAFDLNSNLDRGNTAKQDCNFDYDGNKIQVTSNSKPKANLKILKPLYKLNKQKPQQSRTSKLNKKYHQKMSFIPRGSRNCLEFNSKTISDFDDTNYTLALKEKIQGQLRKTDVKFTEKQFQNKQKLSEQDKNKLNNKRQSLINLN